MKSMSAARVAVLVGLCTVGSVQSLQAKKGTALQSKLMDSNSSSWNPFDWLGGGSSEKEDEADSGEPLPINVVEIEMYYEALCPFCRTIIAGPLAELYNDSNFTERININFYPYGNSRSVETANLSDGYKYWHAEIHQPGIDQIYLCQHGPDECFGNMLQVCAIEEFGNLSTTFIMCMEGNDKFSSEASSYMCAEIMGLNLDPVRACVQGSKGNKKMLEIGDKTENLKKPAGPHEYVPWMTLDGVHCPNCELDGEEGGKGHVLKEVCAILNPPKPSLCTGGKEISLRTERHSPHLNVSYNTDGHSSKIAFPIP